MAAFFNTMGFSIILIGAVLSGFCLAPNFMNETKGAVLVRMSPCQRTGVAGVEGVPSGVGEGVPPAAASGAAADGTDPRPRLKGCLLQTGVVKEDETAKVDAMVSELMRPRNLVSRPPQPLVFTHIPRTAGGFVEANLDHAWSDLGCGKVQSTGAEMQEAVHGAEPCVTLFPGAMRWGIFEPGKAPPNMPPVDRIVGFSGLFSHGVCDFLGPTCTYTTVLREPVVRVISHFKLECEAHRDAFGTLCDSLPEFVKAATTGSTWFYGLDNMQTRSLSGDLRFNANGTTCFDQSTCIVNTAFQINQEHLAKAIDNLVFKYPVWGIMEDLPAYAKRLNRVYGYNIPESDPGHVSRSEADQQTHDALSLVTAQDVTLYRFAKCVLDAGSPRFAT